MLYLLRLPIVAAVCLTWSIFSCQAQNTVERKSGDLPGGMVRESSNLSAVRPMQYHPENGGFVSINGKNRYTRALYGTHTQFRIETSDRPVFAAYNGKINHHISFSLVIAGQSVALDSTAYCKSIYIAGKRLYELKDQLLGKGVLHIAVQALYDREGGVWKLEGQGLPTGTKLICQLSEIRAGRLNRNGDMGADPADAFEAPVHPERLHTFDVDLARAPVFVAFEKENLLLLPAKEGQTVFNTAEQSRAKIAGALKIMTPDPYINTLGGTIAMAADGIWDGKVWLHGAIGWRSQLPGWRAAYTGDMLGWKGRSDIHFDNYAASQVTDVPPTVPGPALDTAMHLARGAYIWGSPMYSNGYICRAPNNNHQMHHYDMNMPYIDELLTHIQWSGDLDYAKKMFPVIKRSIEWETRNWDADGDGIYDNYAGTWASDALGYNSGGTAVASAYNYRANKMAAEIAGLIGEDPAPFKKQADKILEAMNELLWLKGNGQGWWAEYRDFMGRKQVHPDAGLWSVYTPINEGAATPFQAYQATRYVDEYIPHFPVRSDGLNKVEKYATISTTSWMPYVWSVNNVAFGEVGNTALAYWQAGRPDAAFKLFKSTVLDGMYLGGSPGNLGQISYYDAVLGETYRDFGDVIGVYSQDIVQGLFGIYPDGLHKKLEIRPGFPSDWDSAAIDQSEIGYRFLRQGHTDRYSVHTKFKEVMALTLSVDAPTDRIQSVKVNGRDAKWTVKDGINRPLVAIDCGTASGYDIEITWGGKAIVACGDTASGVEQTFTKVASGNLWWWRPENPVKWVREDFSDNMLLDFDLSKKDDYVEVNIDQALNAKVTDIFKAKYLSPRSPYTTLQTPTQGIGDWCQPLVSYDIDDSGLRAKIKDGHFTTPMGIPFRTAASGNNIAFTSQWDNYPTATVVPLSGHASGVCLLMAGTTDHMQYGVDNGKVTISYKDGTVDSLDLQNPDSWCPIEEDYYTDGFAFRLNAPRPYRVSFKRGIVSRNLGHDMGIADSRASNRVLEGGAGVILSIPLDKNKELASIKWEALANQVIIGMMAVTLIK